MAVRATPLLPTVRSVTPSPTDTAHMLRSAEEQGRSSRYGVAADQARASPEGFLPVRPTRAKPRGNCRVSHHDYGRESNVRPTR